VPSIEASFVLCAKDAVDKIPAATSNPDFLRLIFIMRVCKIIYYNTVVKLTH
jgi:hypothetical protein